MPKARKIWTNFTKGELSPNMEGRPDLDLYFAGASQIENFYLQRTGGLTRRVGTRFVAETKNSGPVILLPLEVSSERAFIVEMGAGYARFYKDKKQLQVSAAAPVEIATPYNADNLPFIHFTASVDILFLFHQNYRQRRLSHVDDLTWNMYEIQPLPPPTFDGDTDISDDVPGAGVGTAGDLSGPGQPADPPGSAWIDPTLLPGGGGLGQGNSGGGGD